MKLLDKKILVVDDEVLIAEFLSEVLALEGAEVSVARDGRQALDLILATESRFDLIVSDVRMPQLNGIQLLETLRKDLKNPPAFIFVSGFSDLSLNEAKALGALAVMQKPFDLNALIETVVQALGAD